MLKLLKAQSTPWMTTYRSYKYAAGLIESLVMIFKEVRAIDYACDVYIDSAKLSRLYRDRTAGMTASQVRVHKLGHELAACLSYAMIPAISGWIVHLMHTNQISVALALFCITAAITGLLANAILVAGRVIASHQLKMMINIWEYLELIEKYPGLGMPFARIKK